MTTCRLDMTQGRICATAGDIPACQLCPRSPTYWRDQPPAPPADPTAAGLTAPDPLSELGAMLDWSGGSVGPPSPCVICGKDAILRSPKGQPCHKYPCAEQWQAAHHRTTTPVSTIGQK
jgi:hypothetical protein